MDTLINLLEIKQEDVAGEEEGNGHSPQSHDKISTKRKRKSDLRTSLDQSIRNGKFNLLVAGLAIHNAYENGRPGIPQDIAAFAAKNATCVPFPQMPECLSSDPLNMNSMMHGYGLAAQLAMAAASKTSKAVRIITPTKDNFNFVSDSPSCVKSVYSYPSTYPFSGELIAIDSIPLMDSSTPAHIRLQNYLFQLLGKSCINRPDIQRFWIIPGEKNHRYGDPKPFPKELFENLQQLFLEFFQLDYDDLDEPEYCDEFSEMLILREHPDYESKKLKFEEMSAARKVFKTSIFLLEFKAALKELRHGTFVFTSGTSEGHFAKRQRHISKRLLNRDDEHKENGVLPKQKEIKRENDSGVADVG
ncbi:hypothetical protein GCK72_013816 [Caenorhabditis remanei]|uniref:Uncharacterized protein n=1 Tax=Caenorhabditis remanei TaxID=31234 RepID=A0A6A5GRQ6_CAERE|nr:hypothetical protein GCK72_013816 [Caenorhabditis remanei]KAF1757361.1 hypothetical protein GCK72_013816 [Caenorhabditis remanei]